MTIQRFIKQGLVSALVLITFFVSHASADTHETKTEPANQPTQIYAIPNAFFPAKATQPGVTEFKFQPGKRGAFSFFALLPDFKPVGTNVSELNHGWHRQISVLVEYPMHFRTGDDIAREDMRWNHQTEKDGEDVAGCKRYPNGPLFHIRLCPTQHGSILLRCMNERSVPYPSCTVMDNIGNDTVMTYTYPLKYAEQAIEIDRNLRSLLSSWFWISAPWD